MCLQDLKEGIGSLYCHASVCSFKSLCHPPWEFLKLSVHQLETQKQFQSDFQGRWLPCCPPRNDGFKSCSLPNHPNQADIYEGALRSVLGDPVPSISLPEICLGEILVLRMLVPAWFLILEKKEGLDQPKVVSVQMTFAWNF